MVQLVKLDNCNTSGYIDAGDGCWRQFVVDLLVIDFEPSGTIIPKKSGK